MYNGAWVFWLVVVMPEINVMSLSHDMLRDHDIRICWEPSS